MTNILSLAEIHNLCGSFRALLLFMHEMRKGSELAKCIKLPQVPPVLSESIVVHLIKQGKILIAYRKYKIFRGGRFADILLQEDERKIKVEVKATCEKGFQRLSKPDVLADFLVWVHFDKCFLSSTDSPFTIFIIPKPEDFYKEKEEVFANEVEKRVGPNLQKILIKFSELEKISLS